MPTTSPLEDARKFLRALILADAELVSTFGDRVYDKTPEKPVYPYIRLGDSTSSRVQADAIRLQDATITVHVWSTEGGKSRCQRLADKVAVVLDDRSSSEPSVVDQFPDSVLHTYHLTTAVFTDSDGVTQQGIVEIDVLTEG